MEDNPERYFINEHGLQNKVAGKLTWWTDENVTHHDISTARVFVCKACDKPNTGHKRWLINSDPGRIPEDLKKIPLNMSEQIVLNKYVIFNNTVMLDVVKKNHLSGHVISIPITKRSKQSQEAHLPRLEYSDHIKLAFFGKRGMKKIAFDLMRKHNFDFIVVRPDVIERWMAALEMNEELQRFRDQREEYIQAWQEQERNIRARLAIV